MKYDEFIKRKMSIAPASGIEDIPTLNAGLFPFQASLTEWALKQGRAALFADTGLGKTIMQLEWARVISEQVGRVLILAPLAVSEQTVQEGVKFGIDVVYAREDNDAPIVITNYEMLDRFSPDSFAGIVLDESSILKSYTGAFRNMIIESFINTPYKLACTATPAPNDFTELGNHSEFLGSKTRSEMLAEYFVHDGGSTQDWRLKKHAVDAFWRWVSSWGAIIKKPSDIGYSDDGFILPPLSMNEHVIPSDHRDAAKEGMLLVPQAITLNDQRRVRRMTMEKRIVRAAELAAGDEPVLVWAELNKEADMATAAIDGAVQVKGSDDREVKKDRLLGFAAGKYRALVTKPSIAGFGMNWQHCNRVVFLGASHSYEQTYQAMRRCWRFGQKRKVSVHIIRAESEDAIIANYMRKESDMETMMASMVVHVKDAQAGMLSRGKRWGDYNPRVTMKVPEWIGAE